MMDPRMHRRRIEARREEGKRRFRVLVGVTTVTALACAGWAATGSSLLDVDSLVVVGARHTTVAETRFASGLRLGEALSDVDAGAAARGVERLPWVLHASVSRQWPGTVRIVVEERVPVAVTDAGDGRSAMLDRSGRVLDLVDGVPPGLALLTGLPPAGPAGSLLPPEGVAALTVAVALPAELRAHTAGVAPAAGGTGEVDIRLNPEGMVRLGPPEDLDHKFEAIRTVLAQVDLRNLAVLDVRRPDSPVLTRRETPVKVSTPRVG
jgi:cell division septal protein FtsQ